MEWIEFDRRSLAKATRALEQLLDHAPAPQAAPAAPPSTEELKKALHRCAEALAKASLTGATTAPY